jgi:DNA-binding transcriptional MocR family regulator
MRMWIPRLNENARMKYLGIVEALESDIHAGHITAGERLPPQRAIAENLGVDLTTVTRAFNEARRRGLIQAQAGRGTFISEIQNGETENAVKSPIDLSMNIPPQPANIDFRKLLPQTISTVLSNPRGMLSLHYQESTGSEADRNAAATWLGQHINGTTPERIIITGGAQSALYAICELLLSHGDCMVAGAMTYPGLKAVAAQKGIALHALAMDKNGIIPDAFEQACKTHAPKALYVIPAIDNPTTATLPEERRKKLVQIAVKYGVYIIEDDPYTPLLPDNPPSFAELASDITWHIATLSKCASPSLRIAYVMAPNTPAALRLAGILRSTLLMAPPLMSAVASRWITDGTMLQINTAIRTENNERQKLARFILGTLNYTADPNGHHLWLHLPEHWRARDFAEHADRAGVSIVPASAFSITTQPPEAVRISLGVAPDRGDLEDGLTLLASLITQPSLAVKAVV